MVLEELGIVFIGAIIGSVSGFFFAIYWQRKRERLDIKKLKNLLSDDFKRLYKIIHEGLEGISPYLESEQNMEKLIDELISKKFDSKFVVKFHIPLEFNFWSAITTSGSLIKLELDEIKHMENTYQYIKSQTDIIQKSHEKWINLLGSKVMIVDQLGTADKKELFNATVSYFDTTQNICIEIGKVLEEESKNFDWL